MHFDQVLGESEEMTNTATPDPGQVFKDDGGFNKYWGGD
jgi:hypothetical protein